MRRLGRDGGLCRRHGRVCGTWTMPSTEPARPGRARNLMRRSGPVGTRAACVTAVELRQRRRQWAEKWRRRARLRGIQAATAVLSVGSNVESLHLFVDSAKKSVSLFPSHTTLEPDLTYSDSGLPSARTPFSLVSLSLAVPWPRTACACSPRRDQVRLVSRNGAT